MLVWSVPCSAVVLWILGHLFHPASHIAATCQVLAQLRQQDTVGDTPLHRALAAARYDEELGYWSWKCCKTCGDREIEFARGCSSPCLLMRRAAGNDQYVVIRSVFDPVLHVECLSVFGHLAVYGAGPRLGGASCLRKLGQNPFPR